MSRRSNTFANIHLQRATTQHAEAISHLIQQSKSFLKPWLPEVVEDGEAVAIAKELEKNEHKDFYLGKHTYGIWHAEELVGAIILHSGRPRAKTVEIGYWLGAAYTGKGIMTHACALIISKVFSTTLIKTIIIKCAVGNHAARKIPQRLGFTKVEAPNVPSRTPIVNYMLARAVWLARELAT